MLVVWLTNDIAEMIKGMICMLQLHVTRCFQCDYGISNRFPKESRRWPPDEAIWSGYRISTKMGLTPPSRPTKTFSHHFLQKVLFE